MSRSRCQGCCSGDRECSKSCFGTCLEGKLNKPGDSGWACPPSLIIRRAIVNIALPPPGYQQRQQQLARASLFMCDVSGHARAHPAGVCMPASLLQRLPCPLRPVLPTVSPSLFPPISLCLVSARGPLTLLQWGIVLVASKLFNVRNVKNRDKNKKT